MELAWCDDADASLRLPDEIAAYPIASLNRDLYLWLAALAATPSQYTKESKLADVATSTMQHWFLDSQYRIAWLLTRWPGLMARYQRLVAAEIARRPALARLPTRDAVAERAIQAALYEPGTVAQLPDTRRPPQPVLTTSAVADRWQTK